MQLCTWRGVAFACVLFSASSALGEAHPEAGQWVAGRADFLALPKEGRRAIYSSLPAETQHRMWKEKLAEVAFAAHLTAEQVDAVAWLNAQTTIELFRNPSRADRENLSTWTTKAYELFSADQVLRYFRTLDPLSDPNPQPLAWAGDAPDCACRVSGNCPRAEICRITILDCTPVPGGCLVFGNQLDCVGVCEGAGNVSVSATSDLAAAGLFLALLAVAGWTVRRRSARH